MLGIGAVEYRKSRKLQAEGVEVPGKVVSSDVLNTGKGRQSLSLIVDYEAAENGQGYRKKFTVPKTIFDDGLKAGEVSVVYLADDPTVSSVGDEVKANTEPMAIGGGILLFSFLVSRGLRKKS